ncbi:MAG: hypothetical protein ACPG5U_07805 [Planktomarina sp.]
MSDSTQTTIETLRASVDTPRQILTYWIVRVAIVAIGISIWTRYFDGSSKWWIALATYAVISLAGSFILQTIKAKQIKKIAAPLEDETGHER